MSFSTLNTLGGFGRQKYKIPKYVFRNSVGGVYINNPTTELNSDDTITYSIYKMVTVGTLTITNPPSTIYCAVIGGGGGGGGAGGTMSVGGNGGNGGQVLLCSFSTNGILFTLTLTTIGVGGEAGLAGRDGNKGGDVAITFDGTTYTSVGGLGGYKGTGGGSTPVISYNSYNPNNYVTKQGSRGSYLLNSDPGVNGALIGLYYYGSSASGGAARGTIKSGIPGSGAGAGAGSKTPAGATNMTGIGDSATTLGSGGGGGIYTNSTQGRGGVGKSGGVIFYSIV